MKFFSIVLLMLILLFTCVMSAPVPLEKREPHYVHMCEEDLIGDWILYNYPEYQSDYVHINFNKNGTLTGTQQYIESKGYTLWQGDWEIVKGRVCIYLSREEHVFSQGWNEWTGQESGIEDTENIYTRKDDFKINVTSLNNNQIKFKYVDPLLKQYKSRLVKIGSSK